MLPAYCISGAIGLIGPERTAGAALVPGGVWVFTRKARPKVPEVDVAP